LKGPNTHRVAGLTFTFYKPVECEQDIKILSIAGILTTFNNRKLV
jgi:hypothetical protein